MELDEAPIPSGSETSGTAIPASEAQRDGIAAGVRSLVTGMAILALAGTAVFFMDHGRVLRDVLSDVVSRRLPPGAIFQYVEPVEFLRVGWPLLFVSAFLLLRWPRLTLAAAVTFLALAADRLFAIMIALEIARQPAGLIMPVSPGPTGFLTRSLVVATSVGLVFLVFYAMFGVRAFLLNLRYRKVAPKAPTLEDRNRWLVGRFAVMGALVFAIFLFGARLWTVYDDLLLAMPAFRRMVLRTDPALEKGRGNQRVPNDPIYVETRDALQQGIDAQERKRYDVVRKLYGQMMEGLAKLPKSRRAGRYLQLDAALLANNLAWNLATTPDLAGRDPGKAVSLAKKAVEFSPNDGNSWNTLGVAFYRETAWKEARQALKKSMSLREGGDSFDWYFMAMIAFRDGQKAEAEHWYEKAVAWMKANRPSDLELLRFRAEAADLLGIDDPEAHAPIPEPMRRGGGRAPILTAPD